MPCLLMRPDRRFRIRRFCSSVRLFEFATSKSSITRVFTLLTCCPPGPPLLDATNVISCSGIDKRSVISIIPHTGNAIRHHKLSLDAHTRDHPRKTGKPQKMDFLKPSASLRRLSTNARIKYKNRQRQPATMKNEISTEADRQSQNCTSSPPGIHQKAERNTNAPILPRITIQGTI